MTIRQVPQRVSDSHEALGSLLSAVLCETSPRSRSALQRHAQLRRYERHEQLAEQGFEPWLVLVVSGHLGVWRTRPDGKRQMIRIAHRGDIVSVQALRRHPSAAADLVGLDRGVVARWPGDLVMALARTDAGLALDLLEHSLTSGARLLERLDRVSFDTVSRRLARILWQEQALLFDARRPLLSRPELADLAGATREMTDRVIRDFERRGILGRTGRSGLLLLDVGGLRVEAALDEITDPRDLEPCGNTPGRGATGR